jgi:molybdopterin biosynthesis enzyme
MITPDVAWGIVLEQTRPLESIAVSLADALGYCLAEDVRADRDLPPADRESLITLAVERLPQHPPIFLVTELGHFRSSAGADASGCLLSN